MKWKKVYAKRTRDEIILIKLDHDNALILYFLGVLVSGISFGIENLTIL